MTSGDCVTALMAPLAEAVTRARHLFYRTLIKLQNCPLSSQNNFPHVLGAAGDASIRKIGDLLIGIVRIISQIKEGRIPYCLLAFNLSDNRSPVKCNKKEEMQD